MHADVQFYQTKNRFTPLAGFGVGLPLSQLYATFLGGKLTIVPMPCYGTSALKKIDFFTKIDAKIQHFDPKSRRNVSSFEIQYRSRFLTLPRHAAEVSDDSAEKSDWHGASQNELSIYLQIKEWTHFCNFIVEDDLILPNVDLSFTTSYSKTVHQCQS